WWGMTVVMVVSWRGDSGGEVAAVAVGLGMAADVVVV
nr:hypothetical protein [Tanacetum cinerariifolium]